MTPKQLGDIKIYEFDNLSKFPQIKQFVSTRLGGVSKSPYDSLNLSFSGDDIKDSVLENRKRLARAVGIPYEYFVFPQQIHSANVVRVTTEIRDSWWDDDKLLEATDSLITSDSEVALITGAADCVPIALYDPVNNVIGTAHSGWKGTAAKIVQNTIHRMEEEFKTDPNDLVVGIGPSIGPESYEIDIPVIEKFKEANLEEFIEKTDETHGMLNLWEANRRLILDAGVQDKNIEIAGIDTFTNTHEFYSDRKERPTGRFVSAIMLT